MSTGQRYTSQIFPGGTLSSACPLCVPVQHWTCNGDTFTLLDPVVVTATLSPDGRRLTAGCCVSTRIGGAAVAAAPQKEKQESPQAKPEAKPEAKKLEAMKTPPKYTGTQVVSCSDITGTGSKVVPANQHCKDANAALRAARVTRAKYDLYAAEQYKKAADAYRRAGDTAQVNAVLREAALSNEAFEAEKATAKISDEKNFYRERAKWFLKIARDADDGQRHICMHWDSAGDNYDTAVQFLRKAGDYDESVQPLWRSIELRKFVKDRWPNWCLPTEKAAVVAPVFPPGGGKPPDGVCQDLIRQAADLGVIGDDLTSIKASIANAKCAWSAPKDACEKIATNTSISQQEQTRRSAALECPK